MVNFQFLNKNHFDRYSNKIFNILSDNMKIIAPTGNSSAEDFKIWNSFVSEKIKKPNRQIVLVFKKSTDDVIGFFQYSVSKDTFMMEEIQLLPDFQGRCNVFRSLYSFVLRNIDSDLLYVEAYANKHNPKSIAILGKLGLKVVGENKKGTSFHFKGLYKDLVKWNTK